MEGSTVAENRTQVVLMPWFQILCIWQVFLKAPSVTFWMPKKASSCSLGCWFIFYACFSATQCGCPAGKVYPHKHMSCKFDLIWDILVTGEDRAAWEHVRSQFAKNSECSAGGNLWTQGTGRTWLKSGHEEQRTLGLLGYQPWIKQALAQVCVHILISELS